MPDAVKCSGAAVTSFDTLPESSLVNRFFYELLTNSVKLFQQLLHHLFSAGDAILTFYISLTEAS